MTVEILLGSQIPQEIGVRDIRRVSHQARRLLVGDERGAGRLISPAECRSGE
jgi:hypothetical protein